MAKVRVMSNNVWGNCGKNEIANRGFKHAIITKRYLPDVVGLQEYSPKSRRQIDNIGLLISDIYTEVPAIHNAGGPSVWTPIFYLHDKLTLVDYGFFAYPDMPMPDGLSKTLVWSVFEIKESGERFAYINTHFYWTGDDIGKNARIANAKDFAATAAMIEAKYPGTVIFGTGDYNCRIDSPPLNILKEYGFVHANDIAEVKTTDKSHHPYPTWDEENCIFKNGPRPKENAFEESIDHVFVKGNATVSLYQTVIDKEALDASDHCPVFADFNF